MTPKIPTKKLDKAINELRIIEDTIEKCYTNAQSELTRLAPILEQIRTSPRRSSMRVAEWLDAPKTAAPPAEELGEIPLAKLISLNETIVTIIRKANHGQ